MPLTYTWKVIGLQTKTEGTKKKAVVCVDWEKIGIDENGISGSFQGSTLFTTKGMAKSDFVAFDDLTEENVISWVKNLVDGVSDEKINFYIEKQINEKADIPVATPLPWELK